MIDFNRLTDYTQNIMAKAQELMSEFQNTQMEPVHIVLAMMEEKDGIAQDYANALGMHKPAFQDAVMSMINNLPKVSSPVGSGQLYLSTETIKMFDLAKEEAEKLKDSYISIEHILMAVNELDNSQIETLFNRFGITDDKILNEMKKIRGQNKVDTKDAENNFKALEKYSTNLTDLAKRGKLDPVIGRDEEVRRIIQVLNRRTKNNPVLIGEPGVGKTAIVEGLAQRIIRSR